MRIVSKERNKPKSPDRVQGNNSKDDQKPGKRMDSESKMLENFNK